MWTDRAPPPRATHSKRFKQALAEAVSKMASQWAISFKSTFLRSNSDLRAIDHSLEQTGYNLVTCANCLMVSAREPWFVNFLR